MPFKTFVAGTEGLASDINTYLMEQSVMVFTNATARDADLPTPNEGMVVYLTNSDHYQFYTGAAWITTDLAWNAYTPTLTNVTATSTTAYYYRIGKVIHFFVYVVVSAAPTGIVTVSTPVTSTSVTRQSAEVRMSVAGTTYFGKGIFAGGGTTCQVVAMNASGTYVSSTATSATVPGAWVSGNSFLITGTYEAA
jgi:hypothetical protein